MSRILLEKLEIHLKTSTLGNWKQPILPGSLESTSSYIFKHIRVCENLIMGKTNLDNLMNFLTMQLLEEIQRLVTLLSTLFKAEINAQSLIGTSLLSLGKRLQQAETNFTRKLSNIHETVQIQTQYIPVKQPISPKRSQKLLELPDPPPINPSPQNVPPTQRSAPQNQLISRWLITQGQVKTESVLGSGASCTVYRGLYKKTPVAIKIMKGQMGENLEQEFQRELSAMLMLRHPNLVLFMGASASPQMMIVSELCEGESLYKLLHERKNEVALSWEQRLKMLKDIARGMLYLHGVEPPILHRDLKSLNLLLTEVVRGPEDRICVKITDFGVARILDNEDLKMTGQMGTCHWMAPEVLQSSPYSLAADVYSFGIVTYEILAREIPYKNLQFFCIPGRVVHGERPNLSAVGSGCPAALRELMRSCWDSSPQARPSFDQITDVLDAVVLA